jgi:hypothetical protein
MLLLFQIWPYRFSRFVWRQGKWSSSLWGYSLITGLFLLHALDEGLRYTWCVLSCQCWWFDSMHDDFLTWNAKAFSTSFSPMINGPVDFDLEEVRLYRRSCSWTISSYQMLLAGLGAPVESYALWYMVLHRGKTCILLQAAFVRLNVYRHSLWLDGSSCIRRKNGVMSSCILKKSTGVGRGCILQIKNGTFIGKESHYVRWKYNFECYSKLNQNLRTWQLFRESRTEKPHFESDSSLPFTSHTVQKNYSGCIL